MQEVRLHSMMWKVFAIFIFSTSCMLRMRLCRGESILEDRARGPDADVCCVGQNGACYDFEKTKSTTLVDQYIENGELSFSAKFAEKLVDDLPEFNLIVSTLGAYRLLSLLYGGAIGRTKVELEVALGLPRNSKVPASCLHHIVDKISTSLHTIRRRNFNLDINNVILARNRFHFQDQFKKRMTAGNSDVELRNLDMSDRWKTILAIEHWIDDKLKDFIQVKQFSHQWFGFDDSVFLPINVLYFDALWAYAFNRWKTKNANFVTTDPDTGDVQVDMMQNMNRVPFYRSATKGYTTIALPYVGEKFFMYFVQPNDARRPLAKLVSDLAAPQEMECMIRESQLRRRCVDYRIPRVEFLWRGNLNLQLKSLGVQSALKNESANFGDIFRREHAGLSAFLQATYIKISEGGVVASAREVSCENEVPYIFVLDRPFIVILYHSDTNIILSYGTIHNPKG